MRELDLPAVVSVRGLQVALGGRPVLADVALDLFAGEVLAVVGRSGSGKSTLIGALTGLLPKTATWSASRFVITTAGGPSRDMRSSDGHAFARIRGREVGVVFQEPEASLDPLFRVGAQIAEVLRSGGVARRDANAAAHALLLRCGLAPSGRFARAYPARLSGGENQRVCVAAAIALAPSVLLADEPTSALDRPVAASVLALLREITDDARVATLLVTHDFDVVDAIADRVVVIANGRIVEEGPARAVLAEPREAATRELVSARGGLPS